MENTFKKLLTDLSPIDDVSSVVLHPSVLQSFNVPKFDAVMLARKSWKVYCLVIQDESFPVDKIGINKQITVNLHVKIGDYVRVRPVALHYLRSVKVAPISGSNVSGDLFTPYLKPFFLDSFRPVSTGLSFTVTGQRKPVDFKVVELDFPEGAEQLPTEASSVLTDIRDGGIVSNHCEIVLLPEINSDLNLNFVGYADIGGHDRALKQLREAVELPLRHPEVFKTLGISPPSGVLLFGPPGTGKTLIAKAVSFETGAFFFLINGPEIVSKMSGESEANLRRAFEEATKNAPAIIFIDEIDSIAPKREKSQSDMDKRVVSQLLTLMDGVKKRDKVLVLAATNRPNAIDPALRRFGRFEREIEVGIPDEKGRAAILRIHTKNMKLAENVDLDELASLTHGMVGADLAQFCNEAAYNCVREKLGSIDLEEETVDAAVIDSLAVDKANFVAALKTVDPAALRETAIESPNVRWEDLGGLAPVKEALKELVEYPLRFPEVFRGYGFPPARGCLLWGPPGCGKTMLAKAIATECEANFISVKGPELLNMWVGGSEANVRDVFAKARAAAPCIIFFDEIDSLAQTRGAHAGDSGVGDRVINSILLEMDGVNPAKQVFVVGATNRPDILDPALTRPGRLDQMIYVGLPDEAARKEVFRVHLAKCPLADDVDFGQLAKLTEGYSSADIAGLVKTAAKINIRNALRVLKSAKDEPFADGYPPIGMSNLQKAVEVTKPSVTLAQIQQYLSLRNRFTSGYLDEDQKPSALLDEIANT